MAAVCFITIIPCKLNTACKVQGKPHFFGVFVHVLSKLCTLGLKGLERFCALRIVGNVPIAIFFPMADWTWVFPALLVAEL